MQLAHVPCSPDSHGDAFGADASGQRVDGGARGQGVDRGGASRGRTDAAPTADEERAAEEVGPNIEAVVAVLVALGQDADEGCGFREERELDRSGPGEGGLATFGHGVARSVSRTRAGY